MLTVILYRGILGEYAFTDVYEYLLNGSQENFPDVFLQHGRLLYAVFNQWLFTMCTTVSEARYIRLAGLAGGLVFLTATYILLRHYNFTSMQSALITWLFATTPSFGIIVAWGATYQVPWGMIFGLLAGMVISNGKISMWRMLVSVLSGLAALFFYQPTYTLFLVPVFLAWITHFNQRQLIIAFGTFALTFMVYLLAFNLYLAFSDLPPTGRSSIDMNLMSNLAWFITGPLEQSLSFNLIFLPNFWKYLVRIVLPAIILVTYFHHVRDRKLHPGWHLGILGIFLLFSMLPNTVSADKWISYRTMNALMLMFSVLLGMAVWRIRHEVAHMLTSCLIAAGAFLIASYNINSGFIRIQEREYEVVRDALENMPPGTHTVVVIPAEMKLLEKTNQIQRVVTDEFGRLSTPSAWVPGPMVELILRDLGKEAAVEVSGQHNEGPGILVIDVGKLYF